MADDETQAEKLDREDAEALDRFYAAVGDYPGAPSVEELSRFAFNDYGNAMRLMRLVRCTIGDHGQIGLRHAELLYLREVGWIAFNGQYWDQKSGEQLARQTAHKVGRVVPNMWPIVRTTGVSAKDWWKWATGVGQSGATGAMLKQAESYLTVDFDAFDRDPLALNVENGVLRFRKDAQGVASTKFTQGHRADDRFTRIAAVAYDAEAVAPEFEASLVKWLPNPSWRHWMHCVLGYAATGCTHEQAFFLVQGLGNDGKSTLIGLMRKMLGSYACAAGVETFLDTGPKRGGDANADVARLAGDTRLVSSSEPPRNSKLAEAMLKSFTGGAPILARMLHKGFTEFDPVGKVVMECNNLPKVQGDDEGIWRRIKIVLFEHPIPKSEVDKSMPARLFAERAGVLNWLIKGIEAWLVEGLVEPSEADEFMAGYRRSSSPFGEWFMDCLVVDKEAKEKASDLFASYKTWHADQGHDDKQLMSQRSFGLALNDRQITISGKNGAGQKMRRGARLKTEAEVVSGQAQPDSAGSGGSSLDAAFDRLREIGDDDDRWGPVE